ncbi:MAG TPA: hypothetical protein VH916_03455 [Dehalococcoidia bacterium]
MQKRCYACTQVIRPADGPTLLWAADPARRARGAFHLSCWLVWRNAKRESPQMPPVLVPAAAAA